MNFQFSSSFRLLFFLFLLFLFLFLLLFLFFFSLFFFLFLFFFYWPVMSYHPSYQPLHFRLDELSRRSRASLDPISTYRTNQGAHYLDRFVQRRTLLAVLPPSSTFHRRAPYHPILITLRFQVNLIIWFPSHSAFLRMPLHVSTSLSGWLWLGCY